MNFVRDVPFVPSAEDRVEIMLQLANVKPGEKAVDLGSGDGRVIIGLAKLGAKADGMEIDPELVKRARKNASEQGLDGKIKIINTNYWDEDLSGYDVITIYGITSIMDRLEQKLRKELKPGARVISNYFTFPNWQPVERQGEIYVYVQPPGVLP